MNGESVLRASHTNLTTREFAGVPVDVAVQIWEEGKREYPAPSSSGVTCQVPKSDDSGPQLAQLVDPRVHTHARVGNMQAMSFASRTLIQLFVAASPTFPRTIR